LNLRIALVVPGEYSELVGDLLKHLKKSEAWTKGRATVDDILRFVYTRQMDLWVIVDTDTRTVWGYLITEVKSYPAQKMLVLQYAAGHTGVLEQIEEQLHKLLENFDNSLSESQNMFNHGYRRIWDCGNNVYVYTA
jgi:uncharacterized protein (DUF1786 family)